MKALILCAGQGTRLQPYTRSVPKCLVPVRGKRILDYELDTVRGEVDEIILVTGYLDDSIRSHAGRECTIVHNPDFATTNSLHSLWLARGHVEGQAFVLFNGDLVVDRTLVAQLLDEPAATASLIDSELELRDGEMNVVTRDRRIVAFGKDVPARDAHAQSLQITKFGAADSELLFGRTGELIAEGQTGRFPAFAYDVILARSSMTPVRRKGGIWFEIDTVDDLRSCEESLGRLSD